MLVIAFLVLIGLPLFIILYFKQSWWWLWGTLIGIVGITAITLAFYGIRKLLARGGEIEITEQEPQKQQITTEQFKPFFENLVKKDHDDMIKDIEEIRTPTVGQTGAETSVGFLVGESYNLPNLIYLLAINTINVRYSIKKGTKDELNIPQLKIEMTNELAEIPDIIEEEQYTPVLLPSGETRTKIVKRRRKATEIKREEAEKEREKEEEM